MTCVCIDRKFRNVDFVLIVFKEGVIVISDHYHFKVNIYLNNIYYALVSF